MPHPVQTMPTSSHETRRREETPVIIKGSEHRTWYNLHHPQQQEGKGIVAKLKNTISLWYYRYEVFSATLILESWERAIFSKMRKLYR